MTTFCSYLPCAAKEQNMVGTFQGSSGDALGDRGQRPPGFPARTQRGSSGALEGDEPHAPREAVD